MSDNYFGAREMMKTGHGDYVIYRLHRLEKQGLSRLDELPFSIRVILESLLRQCNEKEITRQDVINLAGWRPELDKPAGLPFMPGRVLMQDFTGVPAVVDLAAMRSAVARLGADPGKIRSEEHTSELQSR